MDITEEVATIQTLARVLDWRIENIVLEKDALDDSVRLSDMLLQRLDVLCEQLNTPAK